MADTQPQRFTSFISALPWILYLALPWLGYPNVGVVAALVAGLFPTLLAKARGHSVKLVDWTMLVFFVVAALATIPGGRSAALFTRYNYVIVWVLFSAMAWITIAAGAPFTIQFARESTPREAWNTPLFKRVNLVISTMWGSAFTTNLIVSMMALQLPNAATILQIGVPIATIVGAIMFTKRYTAIVRAQPRGVVAPAESRNSSV